MGLNGPDKERNEALIKEVAAELEKGNCTIFVGAGFSVPAGLPASFQVMQRLADELRIEKPTEPTQIAQYYENAYGRHRLAETVTDMIRTEAVPTDVHRTLQLRLCSWCFVPQW